MRSGGEGDCGMVYNLNFNVLNLKTDELVYYNQLNQHKESPGFINNR